jgi:hypothetical protein
LDINKRGQFRFLINVLIVLIAGIIILDIFRAYLPGVSRAYAEELCRGSNAIKNRVQWEPLHGWKWSLFPRVCEKTDIDIPEHGKNKDAAMADIRDMVATCWWMWLEGLEENVFGATKTIPRGLQRCFICYSFRIKKGIKPFKATDLDASLDENEYTVQDLSDKCAGNFGGYCVDRENKCNDNLPNVYKKGECEENQKCCYNRKFECWSRGGDCKTRCSSDEHEFHSEFWSCPRRRVCCVNKENSFLTYREYVQKYQGKGAIEIEPNLIFYPQGEEYAEDYAVTFKSDTTRWLWFENEENINKILVSRLDVVENFGCLIQAGLEGEV